MDKIKERLPLRIYLTKLTKEVIERERRYSEESKIDPMKYIRNEFKTTIYR